ncbi:MAG TPA: hypothetical protein VIY86_01900, partial [Pirellulaceae bacterium]
MRQELNLRLALFEADPQQDAALQAALGLVPDSPSWRAVPVKEMAPLLELVRGRRESLVTHAWSQMAENRLGPESHLRLAATLAQLDPKDSKWPSVAAGVARTLVAANAEDLSDWVSLCQPVGDVLAPELTRLFSRELPATERRNLARAHSDLAADDLERLVSAVMLAKSDQLSVVLAPLAPHGQAATTRLRARFKQLREAPNQVPKIPWPDVPQPLAEQIASHAGVIGSQAAMVQLLPLEGSQTVLDDMSKCGYRPTTFRPFLYNEELRVAVGWKRDGQPWRTRQGLSAEELRGLAEPLAQFDLELADISCYEVDPSRPQDVHFAATWAPSTTDSLSVGLTLDIDLAVYSQAVASWSALDQVPDRVFVRQDESGRPLFSILWHKVPKGQGSNDRPEIVSESGVHNGFIGERQQDCQICVLNLGTPDRYGMEQITSTYKLGEGDN